MSDSWDSMGRSAACQASLSVGFSRQEDWSGLPFPSPGDLPYPGIKPVSVSYIGSRVLYHWHHLDHTHPHTHTHVRACVLSRSVVSNSLQPYGLQPTRFLCPWDFPGKNNAVGCLFLLQGIFLTQGLKIHLPYLLHW